MHESSLVVAPTSYTGQKLDQRGARSWYITLLGKCLCWELFIIHQHQQLGIIVNFQNISSPAVVPLTVQDGISL